MADMFSRRDGAVAWAVRSIYGRIVVTRTDLREGDVDADEVFGVPESGTGWNYAMVDVPDEMPDGWRASWKKTLGVEWRHESLLRQPAVIGGWWLRVRWRTITLLAMVPPLLITMLHESRRRRSKRHRETAALAAVQAPGA